MRLERTISRISFVFIATRNEIRIEPVLLSTNEIRRYRDVSRKFTQTDGRINSVTLKGYREANQNGNPVFPCKTWSERFIVSRYATTWQRILLFRLERC